jgi:hypothetical protein
LGNREFVLRARSIGSSTHEAGGLCLELRIRHRFCLKRPCELVCIFTVNLADEGRVKQSERTKLLQRYRRGALFTFLSDPSTRSGRHDLREREEQ